MGLSESIRLALEGLRANKMRSLLTMLGIIIGIGAVIGILTVGNGLTGSITGSMSGLGASNIAVTLREKDDETGGMMSMMGMISPEKDDLITEDMLSALRERAGQGRAAVRQRQPQRRQCGVWRGEQSGAAGRTVDTGEGY